MIAPRDHALAVGGLALHYVTWGRDSAPPVVLLHGITGHARTWDALARDLSTDFRVIALDQRGHGDSDRAPGGDYRVATMASDVAGFADALGLARFSLIGLSASPTRAITPRESSACASWTSARRSTWRGWSASGN